MNKKESRGIYNVTYGRKKEIFKEKTKSNRREGLDVPLSSPDDIIITFYSDRNLKDKASISPRHTSISQVHTLTNQGTNATSIANVIISFYFDKNLKDKMQFKNPQVNDNKPKGPRQ